MVRNLIKWAKATGWECIEANSFEDIPIFYEISGSAGHAFGEKLGFSIVDRFPYPDLQGQDQFVTTLEEQAKILGSPPERAREQIIMHLDLT